MGLTLHSILFCMKPDFYTKAVLTVIAVLLAVIAVKPLVSPDMVANAQRSLNKARNSRGAISVILSAYRKR
jgi:hypothetical protein